LIDGVDVIDESSRIVVLPPSVCGDRTIKSGSCIRFSLEIRIVDSPMRSCGSSGHKTVV